jgi:type I restriction enzyme R subunit
VFIRSLVGLDRDAATDALSGFVNGRTLTADQHDFIALVVEHLTANGAMDVGLLYEQPFTSLAAGGPESLFPDADVDELVAAIRAVGENALPQDEVA